MTLTIPLDEALTSQLRQYAADRQLPMEAFVVQLLHEAVIQLADTACWQQRNERRVALLSKLTRHPLHREGNSYDFRTR